MSFVRPEAAAQLYRWREALAGGALLGLGLWLAWGRGGLPLFLGSAAALLGVFLIVSGLRHGFFQREGAAPGIVEVDEGRITYLGPILGGSVALADLRKITFRRTGNGEAFWRFESLDAPPLIIPAGAQGVEALIDACTVLPKFDAGVMVRAVQLRTKGERIIWQTPALT